MVREHAGGAVGACDDRPDYDYADGVELRVYALVDGQECSTIVYDMKQQEDLAVSVVKDGASIRIQAKGNKPYTVRLVNVRAVSANGASMVVDGKDTVLTPSDAVVDIAL